MYSESDAKSPKEQSTEVKPDGSSSLLVEKVTTICSVISKDESTSIQNANVQNELPDGGLRAWLVVVGGFIIYYIFFGLVNAFGVFQTYYTQHILAHKTPSQISWIGGTQVFILFGSGVIVGPIYDRRGTRILLIPGTIMFTAALIITSFSKHYYQFMLAQGIINGIADACLFYPTVSVMSQWFRKQRGLALGIIASGSSLGGITWPVIMEHLIKSIGFQWTVRTMGLVCLVLLCPCCVLVAPRIPPSAKTSSPATDLNNLFKDVKYLSLVAGYVLVIAGLIAPYYFIPAFGISQGMSTSMATYLVSVLHAGSLVGRIAAGYCADKGGAYNTTTCCALISGVIVLCMTQFRAYIGPILFACFYGLFSGGMLSLQSTCVAQITPNLEVIGIKIGFLMSISSVGALLGAPVGGALISKDGQNFTSFSILVGLVLVIGASLVGTARILLEKRLFVRV